jgi:hypothetical protein
LINSKVIIGVSAGIIIVIIGIFLSGMDLDENADKIIVSDSSTIEQKNQTEDTANYIINEDGAKSFIITTTDVPDIAP